MSANLWSARTSTASWLDELRPREITPDEAARIRASVQRLEDDGPFRCECLRCRCRRAFT